MLLSATGCTQKPVESETSGDLINVTLEPVRTMQYTEPVRTTGILGTASEIKSQAKALPAPSSFCTKQAQEGIVI